MKNPEEFTTLRERIELDHAECPSYLNARMAQNARQMKKRMAREMAALQKPPGASAMQYRTA